MGFAMCLDMFCSFRRVLDVFGCVWWFEAFA